MESSVREKALKLRLKGLSYNEINAKLGVPKATLSGWFTGLVLPESSIERLKKRVYQGTLNGLVKRNKAQTHLARKRALENRQKGAREIPLLSRNDLFLLGISLYWAEGYKKAKIINGKERTSHSISFTNADPEMIKFFIHFLVEYMEISSEEISIDLRLFPHIKAEKAINYWSQNLEFLRENFNYCYVVSRASQGKRPFNQLFWGTVQVRVNSTEKFHRLMGWIEGVKRQLSLRKTNR